MITSHKRCRRSILELPEPAGRRGGKVHEGRTRVPLQFTDDSPRDIPSGQLREIARRCKRTRTSNVKVQHFKVMDDASLFSLFHLIRKSFHRFSIPFPFFLYRACRFVELSLITLSYCHHKKDMQKRETSMSEASPYIFPSSSG